MINDQVQPENNNDAMTNFLFAVGVSVASGVLVNIIVRLIMED